MSKDELAQVVSLLRSTPVVTMPSKYGRPRGLSRMGWNQPSHVKHWATPQDLEDEDQEIDLFCEFPID
jgi:hypothetical protein